MKETIERYQKHVKDTQPPNKPSEENIQQLKEEAAHMVKKIEALEASKRKLLGEGVGSCTIEELLQIEQQLEKSVCTIRAKKNQVFKEQIEQLKEKEKLLMAENVRLVEKCGMQPWQGNRKQQKKNDHLPGEEGSPVSDVETELFIGLPEKRSRGMLFQK